MKEECFESYVEINKLRMFLQMLVHSILKFLLL